MEVENNTLGGQGWCGGPVAKARGHQQQMGKGCFVCVYESERERERERERVNYTYSV